MGSVPGSGAAVWLSVWVSARSDLEKVPAFFDFAGTFLRAIPIETHGGSFYCIIWLDAGTFSNKILYRPANKLRDNARAACALTASTDSGHNRFSLHFTKTS